MSSKSKHEDKLQKLINAGKEAFELLLEEVKKPLDPELQDDRARNAMKAKQECFVAAQDILSRVRELEAQLNGEDLETSDFLKKKDFQAGLAEKFAKNKK